MQKLRHINLLLEKPASGEAAKHAVIARKKAAGAAARAEKDRLFGRDVARSMASKRRATPEEVTDISRMLNMAQHTVVPAWETPSWFKLFRHVDGDGSGLICYDEFVEMARDVLKLSERDMPKSRLQALWLALDTDSSGYLDSGEFGAFMRLGEPVTDRSLVAKLSVAERKKAAGAAARAEKDRLFGRDVARSMASKRRATPEEVTDISRMLNMAQHTVVPAWETPSWFKLFRHVDGDGSGLICYDEFVEMARDVLKLSERDMPKSRLQALWLALDTDSSGYLDSGEFGAFMRLGEVSRDALRTQRDELQQELRRIAVVRRREREREREAELRQKQRQEHERLMELYEEHGSRADELPLVPPRLMADESRGWSRLQEHPQLAAPPARRPAVAWEEIASSWAAGPPACSLDDLGDLSSDASPRPGGILDSWRRQHELATLKERFSKLDVRGPRR